MGRSEEEVDLSHTTRILCYKRFRLSLGTQNHLEEPHQTLMQNLTEGGQRDSTCQSVPANSVTKYLQVGERFEKGSKDKA